MKALRCTRGPIAMRPQKVQCECRGYRVRERDLRLRGWPTEEWPGTLASSEDLAAAASNASACSTRGAIAHAPSQSPSPLAVASKKGTTLG